MGRWGDGETGRRGDGETGRRGAVKEGMGGRWPGWLARSLFMVTVKNATPCAKTGATQSGAKRTKKNRD